MSTTTNWLTVTEVEKVYPRLTAPTQQTLRTKRKIRYAKIAGSVVYRPEWIDEYIERSIVEPIESGRRK